MNRNPRKKKVKSLQTIYLKRSGRKYQVPRLLHQFYKQKTVLTKSFSDLTTHKKQSSPPSV